MSVPKLRFKCEDETDFPEWEKLTMSEIFTEIIEKNRSDLPVLSILQGKGTVYRDSSERNIMYNKKSTVNYKAMKKGDFIIHLRTFEGGLECATLDGISSSAYKILRTDKLIPEAYKDYFRSESFISGRLAISVTGVRDGKNIDMSAFGKISIPVPCIEEQQKIADFLSTVDEVIAQSEAEVKNLEQQKKGVMQKIFSQEVRFKRDDGAEFPKWEEKTMSEIFTEIIEKNRPDLPVLSILQGKGTVYRDSADRNIMYDKKNTANYKAMKKGDFIIHLRTFEGGLECATLDGISSPAYKILRTNKLIPEAYKDYFRSKFFIAGKLAISVTGVRDGKNIEMNIFWQISIPVPCLEEQQKIADFLSAYDEAITCAKQELEHWKQLKKGLLQQMFI